MKSLVVFLLLTATAWGVEREQVDRLLAQAAESQGGEYLKARGHLAAMGEETLPLLREAAEDEKLKWQQRLAARIAYERIVRGEEIEAVRFHRWVSYPPYQKTRVPKVGPSINMGQYVMPRLREAGLWYYYIELTWKGTGEAGIAWGEKRYQRGDPRFSGEAWPLWCRAAVIGQPEEIYLWWAIADRIENEEDFLNSYDNQMLYTDLYKRKLSMAVPALLKSRRINSDHMAYILSFAEPQHMELLETFIAEREAMLGELRPKLEEVRRREPKQVEEPPFRSEKRPPLEGMVKPPPGFFDPPRPPDPPPPTEGAPRDVLIDVNSL